MDKWKIFKTDTPKSYDVFYYSTDDVFLGEFILDTIQAKRLVRLLNKLSDTYIYLVRCEND